MAFQTEYEFTLPMGFVDENGDVHKSGIMRLATAADEILPLKDPRVRQNPAYLTIILLSRVVVSLGSLEVINPRVIEGLFSSDFAYLQQYYSSINGGGNILKVECPKCSNSFEVEVNNLGEG